MVCLTAAATTLHAQNVSFESVRIAESITQTTWDSVEKSLPTLALGLESQFRASGATEKASKVFAEEMKRSMNRENLTKALAQMLTESFNSDELAELAAFVQSKVGKKYLELSKEMGTNPKHIFHILRLACAAANAQLGTIDRGSISSACSRF